MARVIRSDSMDFVAYEMQTEHSTKVRKASEFFDDVRQSFAEKDAGKRYPRMTSTKVGRFLEFLPGNVTVWAGFNGHKKSMFTSQVALDLCAAGERVLMASMEMTPGETLARSARQASACGRPSDRWIDDFQQWTNGRLWVFDHMGRVTPQQVLGLCRYFAEELKGRHVFVDSLMMVVGSEESMDEQKQFMTDLVQCAQDTQIHIHLVAHCRKPSTTGETLPPSKYDIKGTSAISDQASNVVLVWCNKAKQQALEKDPGDAGQLEKPDAMVIVDKQRHGSWEGKLSMWFDGYSLRFLDGRMTQAEPYDFHGEAQ